MPTTKSEVLQYYLILTHFSAISARTKWLRTTGRGLIVVNGDKSGRSREAAKDDASLFLIMKALKIEIAASAKAKASVGSSFLRKE